MIVTRTFFVSMNIDLEASSALDEIAQDIHSVLSNAGFEVEQVITRDEQESSIAPPISNT